jgi:hypothetical protein
LHKKDCKNGVTRPWLSFSNTILLQEANAPVVMPASPMNSKMVLLHRKFKVSLSSFKVGGLTGRLSATV